MQFTLAISGKGFGADYTDTCTFLQLRKWYDMLIELREAEEKSLNPSNILEG